MLYGLGINHETAPIDIRENVAFSNEKLTSALHGLINQRGIEEAVVLSTCNRTEVYCHLSAPKDQDIRHWLHQVNQLTLDKLNPYIYQLHDIELVKHIMRVASGLNSMILGEPQILGQLKQAHQHALKAGTVHGQLDRLFQNTYQAAKYIRSKTTIGTESVSVAFAATRLAKQIFDDLESHTALVIGGGETAELVSKHLKEQNIGNIIIANRTLETAQQLATKFSGYAITLKELHQHLSEADIIISSTASPTPILGKGAIETTLKKRQNKPIFLVDLAVPRDIEQEAGSLPNVYLYTVDDLNSIIQTNYKKRKQAAQEAEVIIQSYGDQFMQWIQSREITPLLCNIRNYGETIRQHSVEQATRQLKNGQDPETIIEQMAQQLTNKFLHLPTTSIKRAAENNDFDQASLIESIYTNENLNKK